MLVHNRIVEMHQMTGRPAPEIERDIHEELTRLNRESSDQIDFEYRNTYGVGIHDAIMNDSKLSRSLKREMEIELKGRENMTAGDRRDLDMFATERERKLAEKSYVDQALDAVSRAILGFRSLV